ncbi:polysaccharide pyruvyl transferase family protein [Microbacterium sp. BK668]|uniref:polysaccharide pyruvyl transferase family protein n=1 Tax=Microbacterium sp. BK668 TaxID=2512118 RepID=UPI0010D0A4C4|nr:polysaccharide pyruvyl transferase family protein [Microbacterium sp. BK668]TDN90553.1 hypothetical protein EV279_0040 [Microbacterium sp. BK668]
MPAERDVFAVGRGQYENIGDIILRRPLLRWAREGGRLHVYVGRSPAGYDDGLGVGGADVVYRSLSKWYLALLASALRGRASTIYKPGEIQLTLIGMKEHVVMLPAAALVRLRGGTVSRIGVGARNFAPLPRAIMWPSNALASYSRWRDDRTAAYFGGEAMPDLGFAEGMPDEELREAIIEAPRARDVMVISLRDDTEVAPRPYPSKAWLDGVSDFARSEGLTLWVVTQVSVDDDRSRRLAVDLGAQLLGWDELADHGPQEARLRALYRRTRVAASDRLHVIIAAFTEGAAPVGLQLDDSDKVSRHFSTIGIEDVSINTTGMPAGDLAESLSRIAGKRREMLEKLLVARARLASVRADLSQLLTGAASVPEEAPVG